MWVIRVPIFLIICCLIYLVSRKDQSYGHKNIYQKIILLFWVYWSMSDYNGGTKESWGWFTRLRESWWPLLGFKGEKNGHSSLEAESSVNVKMCFITNIIKENFPKSTSWKIPTQCNWRFTQRKNMLSAGQRVAFLSQT